MELRWLEDFVVLSETLNFSRAAERRNITQPAFSRRIRALEDWVGAGLVERTTHSVALTPSGQHFLAHARAVCFSLAQAKREASELAKSTHASLNIAATHALSFTFIPEWLRQQNDVMSLGPLNLVSDSMQACENLMQKGGIDFLIAHAHPDAPSELQPPLFQSRIIGHDQLVAMVSPSLASQIKTTKQPAPYLAYSQESGLGRIIDATCKHTNTDDLAKAGFTSHLAATLLSMTKSGAGVAWLPESLAGRDRDTGQLEIFNPDFPTIALEIRISRPRRRLSKIAEELWSSLP
ncbi:MAG: LysR family transcriptional regulator [Thalassospira sp.]|uniref:LysR family transcriptional regulator n=1 Tax=Thalassospira sp. TaxID=1912094 RepID=UPI0032EEFFA5